ncbi:MAG: protein translocase subunit SecD, partial [Rikenellaceae bacterium]
MAANAKKANPLFSIMAPMINPQTMQPMDSPVIGYSLASDTAKVNAIFDMQQIKQLLPRGIKLMWGVKAMDKSGTTFQLYAINANTKDGNPKLDGGAVVTSSPKYSEFGSGAEVSMTMNSTGSKVWGRMTGDNIGKCIAIVLDGYVYSAPVVNGAITGGSSQITGNFTYQEATDLANVLQSGKLPASARIIQEAVVGPSLGQESIDAGMTSFVIAFIFVLIYMIFYYSTAGVVASIALLSNLFFLFGVLASFGAVGMAVDANVIIYERIKEELKAGKGLSLSLADGFKQAYSAIIDGNATTLITGIVLFVFGSGPVQGFATTLVIGIITSLFTSIFITRVIFVSLLDSGKKISFSNSITKNVLENVKFNFVAKRKISYVISGILILVSAISLATIGLSRGVDFSGGRSYVIRFDHDIHADAVRDALTANENFKSGLEVKQFGDASQMRIVTQYKYDDVKDNVTDEI